MYKVIFKDSNSAAPILYWYCKPTCRKLANNFIDGLLKVQLEIEKIGREVKGVKDKVMKIEEGEFTPKMAEAVKNIACGFGNEGQASDNAEINRNEIIKLVEEKTKEQRAEVEDRARRSKNLIIFGLPEPTSNDRNARQAEEGSSVEKLLVEVNSRHIPTETRRLGRFSAGMQKPRPLRMSFTNQANRDELLQAFRRARREEVEVGDAKLCTKISARKDLTPTERKEDEVLFKEMKLKQDQSKEEGDNNAKWVRKNGKVVNVGKYPKLPEEEEGRG